MAEASTIKEIKAYARGIHMSARKMRLVANLVKGMPVEEAIANLGFMTKKAARPIKKLVDSGAANAKHNFQVELERLFIKSLTVDSGQALKRFRPRAQGRAFPIKKRTSHVNLILGVYDKARISKRKIASKPKFEETAVKEAAAEEPKSRFGFLRRKKEGHKPQLPAKQDAQGKYTSFDRRGGE